MYCIFFSFIAVMACHHLHPSRSGIKISTPRHHFIRKHAPRRRIVWPWQILSQRHFTLWNSIVLATLGLMCCRLAACMVPTVKCEQADEAMADMEIDFNMLRRLHMQLQVGPVMKSQNCASAQFTADTHTPPTLSCIIIVSRII